MRLMGRLMSLLLLLSQTAQISQNPNKANGHIIYSFCLLRTRLWFCVEDINNICIEISGLSTFFQSCQNFHVGPLHVLWPDWNLFRIKILKNYQACELSHTTTAFFSNQSLFVFWAPLTFQFSPIVSLVVEKVSVAVTWSSTYF